MEGLKLNENIQLIQCFMDIKDKISYDINTFFLNGVIIELNSRQLYEHAIILFKWMDRNVVINHRPNTSTYNMMILVYGSMQQYAYAKEMFLQMQQQWHTLNNTESYLETFEEIMSSLQQKGGVRSRESSQQQNVKSNEQSESEDDNKSGTNSQFMGSPNTNETSNFKHASDAIQKHLNLRIPPANINSYVSMVNILSRQQQDYFINIASLYNDILDVLSKVKESYQTAKHPLLIYDLEDQAPLYQSIIKNLLNSKNDQLKLKAVKFAIESLQKGYQLQICEEFRQFIQDKLIYQDCQNYLQIQCEKKNCDEKKKNLRDSLQDLLNECNINFDELIGKSSKSSLKILTSSDGTRIKEWRRSSNLYSDKASYKREKETFSNSSLCNLNINYLQARDYESDEYQKPIHQKQGYHQKQGTKFSRKSVSKTQDTNPHFTSDSSKFRSDQQLNFKIEEMVEEDSPVKVSQRNKMKLFEQKHEVTAKQSIKPLKFD